ncbi:MAG: DnaA N-terminal domain-containing protein, partial [Chromatocurvus sp.]
MSANNTKHRFARCLPERERSILSYVSWSQCKTRLQDELPAQQFNTWIRPLQASEETGCLRLYAPNRFIRDFVTDKFAGRISELVRELLGGPGVDVVLEIGSGQAVSANGEVSAAS